MDSYSYADVIERLFRQFDGVIALPVIVEVTHECRQQLLVRLAVIVSSLAIAVRVAIGAEAARSEARTAAAQGASPREARRLNQ